MRLSQRFVRRIAHSAGYIVVRSEAAAQALDGGSRRADDSAMRAPTDDEVGRCRPWPIPADLAARGEPWARVLVELYGRPASWPACVSPETGQLIHALVRNIRPRTVIETGTCHGASTIWIAAALSMNAAASGSGEVLPVIHTFDNFLPPSDPQLARMPLHIGREAQVRERFERAGVSSFVRVHVGDSAERLTQAGPELITRGGVSLAFLDGDHSPEGVARDFAAVEPLLDPEAFVLLHDVFPSVCNHAGPRWLADHVHEVARGRYQVCDLFTAPLNYGLTLLRRIG